VPADQRRTQLAFDGECGAGATQGQSVFARREAEQEQSLTPLISGMELKSDLLSATVHSESSTVPRNTIVGSQERQSPNVHFHQMDFAIPPTVIPSHLSDF
jgi:hypothetical protein